MSNLELRKRFPRLYQLNPVFGNFKVTDILFQWAPWKQNSAILKQKTNRFTTTWVAWSFNTERDAGEEEARESALPTQSMFQLHLSPDIGWLYGERSQRGSYWNWTVLFIRNVHSYCDRRVSRECKKHTAWREGWQTSHLAVFIPLVNKLILNLTLAINWCQLASKPQHKSDSLQDRWVALFTSGLSLL